MQNLTLQPPTAANHMHPRVLLAHPGTQHVHHLARELEQHGLLDSLWTGIAISPDTPLGKLTRSLAHLPGFRGLSSRQLTGVPAAKIHNFPGLELQALAKLRFRESNQVIHERNAAFQRAIPATAWQQADAVIGFDTSSWILAERLQPSRCPLLLDRTIAHPASYHRIMGDVAKAHPRWVASAPARHPEQERLQTVEHDNAHSIVVGSRFVANSLLENDVDPSKIVLNPYGVDWPRFSPPLTTPTSPRNRPFRFLFVGSVIARKGVPLLLEAWRAAHTHDAELLIAGRIPPDVAALLAPQPGMRLLGQVSCEAMPSLYAEADVLVLPTYFEGFSLTILEAIAAGLAVITTPNSGAEDLLADQRLGCLIPTGQIDALVAALEASLQAPPARSEILTIAQDLAQTYSWKAYGDRWNQLLSTLPRCS